MQPGLNLSISMAMVLVGCASPAPVAENFPISYQKVARTAHHWEVVADDVAKTTTDAIARIPQLQGRPIHVAKPEATAFNKAFRDYMITHLVRDGASVSVCQESASARGFQIDAREVTVQYKAQLIRHGEIPPYYAPGRITALAAGVTVFRDAAMAHYKDDDKNLGVFGLFVLGDVALGRAARATATEVVVTTTIAEANRYLVRRSDTYYVPESDFHLFEHQIADQPKCPGDPPVAAIAPVADPTAPDDAARWRQFVRDMARHNPYWPGM